MNYFSLYLILTVVLILAMLYAKNKKVILIAIIFSIAFLQGVLTLVGIDKFVYQLILELCVFLLFFHSVLNRRNANNRFIVPGLGLFILYSLIVYFSYYINNASMYESLLFYRVTFINYLLFLGIVNSSISELKFFNVNKLIIIYFIMQIPASLVKYLMVGQLEEYIGTVSITAGQLSALIPLLCISFLLAFYLNKKINLFIFLTGVLGFTFMNFVGGKRAYYFLLPIVIILTIILVSDSIKLRNLFSPKLLIITSILVSIVFYSGGVLIPTLNPERKIGGSFNPNHMFEYFNKYVNAYKYGNVSIGRLSSTKNALNNVIKNKPYLGFGPDALYASPTSIIGKGSNFNIAGGRTGLTFHLISIGILGTSSLLLLYLYFSIRFFNFKTNLKNSFQKALYAGTKVGTILIFIDFFLYSRSFMYHYIPSLIMFYLWGMFYKVFNDNLKPTA